MKHISSSIRSITRGAVALLAGTAASLAFNAPAHDVGPSASLTIQVVGKGTARPNYNGVALAFDHSHQITASPARGFRFTEWVGTVEGLEVLRTNSPRLSFMMQSNLVLTARFADILKPRLKITAPTRNQLWSNSVFTVRGTAADNGTLAGVKCQVNDGPWSDAQTSSGWSNWTAEVTLRAGTNVIRAVAFDADDNASATNTTSVTYVEMVRFLDYQPMAQGAEWLYEGFDWDGNAAKVHYKITSTNHLITNYFGRQVVSYVTNCILSTRAYLHPASLEPYDTWEEFLTAGPGFGFLGNDDLPDESLRVAGGLVFPELMPVGSKVLRFADTYSFGKRVGRVSTAIEILDRGARSVPAGTFPDVLRIRFTIKFGQASQVHEEWWAKDVGMIKRTGVSGGGSAVNYELISRSIPAVP